MEEKFTTKDDLYDRVYGIEQYTPGDPSARELGIGISSGTTKGKPSMVVHHRERGPSETDYLQQTSMYGPSEAVLRLSATPQNTHYLITEVLNAKQPERFFIATRQDIETVWFPQLLLEFAPTQISAFPSFLIYMLTTLEENEAIETLAYLRDNINAAEFAGEQITDVQERVLKSFLPNVRIYNDFSLSELPWYIAPVCPVKKERGLSEFCITRHFTDRFEILAPDEAGVGEIIIHTRELGRYKTGDMGTLGKQKCVCGSELKLTVLGRHNYDIVQCVGAVFLVSEVDRVFATLSDYVSDYLAEVTERTEEGKQIQGAVKLTIVPTARLLENPTAKIWIINMFENRLFVTPTKVLRALVEKEVFFQTVVIFKNEIERGHKKMRLRRV